MYHFSRAGTILILSLIIAGVFIPSTVAENNTTFHGITYFTEEFPPFNYLENNSTAGIAISLLHAITKENGDEISSSDITIVPLQEGLSTVRNTTGSAIFSIAKTPDREPNYRWVGPFATYDIVLYSLKSSNLTISSPEDLQNYTFGAVTSDVSIEKLSQIGVNSSKIITDQDPIELFKLLKSGKIDLVTTSDTAGKYFLKKMNEFTHQGVFKSGPSVVYPGTIDGEFWDKARLETVLKPVLDFQRKYGVHIYVGEFSAIRWSPQNSGYRYLKDVIDLFESYGWDWSYHAFREWSGWSVEHNDNRQDNQPSATPTERQKLLKEWFAKNQKPAL